MNTTLNTAIRLADGKPPAFADGIAARARPARRGHFWPGERASASDRSRDAADALALCGFILPDLAGGRGPQTL
jgi:hypothetical protein